MRIAAYFVAVFGGLFVSAIAVYMAILHGPAFFYSVMGIFAAAHFFCIARAVDKGRAGNHGLAVIWLFMAPALGFAATVVVIIGASLLGYG